jgi:probable F420-dependent oxidoreductase
VTSGSGEAVVRFTVPLPMLPAHHYVPMARAAEAHGFDSIAVPDSVFFAETVSGSYPFSADGERWWPADTPFLDPFVAVPAMAAVTTRIRFLTNVLKLPLRHPLLVAKQVASIAALSGDRFRLGVGVSWMPEEFAWTGTSMRTRGQRTDEAIDIVRAVCAGGGPRWVEHHGRHYDFDRLMISPAPAEQVPILVGGHSDVAMQRAVRNDGWVSANCTEAELGELVGRLRGHLAAVGRDPAGFEVNALAVDVLDADGFGRLGDLGVTDCQVVPWYFYGGDPASLDVQLDSLARFADTVIARMEDPPA